MIGRKCATATVTAALLLAAAATAKRRSAEPTSSDALQPVLACRLVTGEAERLACYDKAAAVLGDAAAKRDIVVVDAQVVSKARRSLFGFSTAPLDLFKSKADEPEPTEVSSTVRAARRDADGNWIVTIDDGAVWHQTGGMVGGTVKAGDAVIIKRATLGSYFMRLGKRPGVKARREG
ncbi:hypothetical protein [Sphingomonas sp.]|uniref:hypothetical protein n=1 Tax=Sphingomonas sp. TaxID=28214 RepID=UPI003B001A7A